MMKLTPVFCTAIIGTGKRKALQELKLTDIEGRGKLCTGRIEYSGDDETDRAEFEKLGESLTRAEIKELAQQMADHLAA